jgi:hypothetical protein
MRRISVRVLFVALLALLLTGCAGTRADRSWSGAYEYVDAAGQTAGGTAVVVAYRLEIPAGTPSQGTLRITGYQRDETIRCDVFAAPAEMTVRFRSYGDGQTANAFGVTVFQPNQILFSLQTAGQTNDLATRWQGLRPDGARTETGRYFQKTGG